VSTSLYIRRACPSRVVSSSFLSHATSCYLTLYTCQYYESRSCTISVSSSWRSLVERSPVLLPLSRLVLSSVLPPVLCPLSSVLCPRSSVFAIALVFLRLLLFLLFLPVGVRSPGVQPSPLPCLAFSFLTSACPLSCGVRLSERSPVLSSPASARIGTLLSSCLPATPRLRSLASASLTRLPARSIVGRGSVCGVRYSGVRSASLSAAFARPAFGPLLRLRRSRDSRSVRFLSTAFARFAFGPFPVHGVRAIRVRSASCLRRSRVQRSARSCPQRSLVPAALA
jgi:hypothetical protein